MQVVSSNIKTADYDRKRRELRMIFINRPRWVYIYKNVSLRIWNEFVRSSSKGQYFSQIIRDSYTYKRIVV